MQKHNLREFVEYDEKVFLSKALVNQPGFRIGLLNLRAGQSVPEQHTGEMITIYAVSGHVTFYQDGVPVDLKAGEILGGAGNALLRIEAHEDSSLLVVAVSNTASAEEELDLRAVERFQRHPLVFAKFDALSVGESFILINDHDPVPLNRQMDSMRPQQLTWEYIVRGPEIFRIRVRRTAPLSGTESSPIAQPQTLWGIQPTR